MSFINANTANPGTNSSVIGFTNITNLSLLPQGSLVKYTPNSNNTVTDTLFSTEPGVWIITASVTFYSNLANNSGTTNAGSLSYAQLQISTPNGPSTESAAYYSVTPINTIRLNVSTVMYVPSTSNFGINFTGNTINSEGGYYIAYDEFSTSGSGSGSTSIPTSSITYTKIA